MIDVEAYRRDSYTVGPGLQGADAVDALLQEIEAIASGERGRVRGMDALDRTQPLLPPFLALHFPHKMSGAMLALVRHPAITAELTPVIGPDVKCMQSMMFVKRTGKDPYASKGREELPSPFIRAERGPDA